MRRDCTPTWIDDEMRYRPLRRIRLRDREFSEAYLQAALHARPELLPIDELDADFGPLVSLGREVDSIDNLFIDPTGKITIVETKRWRNPEATRQVLAQILEYATRVSSWSYQKFEDHCRRAMSPAPLEGKSLYSLVQEQFPDETLSESEFFDSVQKSLRTGRFLLLIVGDGIREGLTGLLSALHTQPSLLFTFGLVELQVFEDPDTLSSRLIVPHIVSYSTEIVRAVVRVETTGHADVTVEIEDTPDSEENRPRRHRLSVDEFFEKLPSKSISKTVHEILASARELRAIVQTRSGSVAVRLKDPGGTKQKLSLFVITTAGDIYTGWLSGQLEKISSDKKIAADWIVSLSSLVPGVQPSAKDPDGLSRFISVEEIEPVLDDFVEQLGETIEAIQSSRG